MAKKKKKDKEKSYNPKDSSNLGEMIGEDGKKLIEEAFESALDSERALVIISYEAEKEGSKGFKQTFVTRQMNSMEILQLVSRGLGDSSSE